MQHRSDVEAADALRKAYQQISAEIGKVIIGQEEVLDQHNVAVVDQDLAGEENHRLEGFLQRTV